MTDQNHDLEGTDPADDPTGGQDVMAGEGRPGSRAAADEALVQPELEGFTSIPDAIEQGERRANDLLGALAGELPGEAYMAIERAGRTQATDLYPKSSDAEEWWAYFVGYLDGALQLVDGSHDGAVRFVQGGPVLVAEAAILAVASIAAHADDEVARELTSRFVPLGWSSSRAFLEGARGVLEIQERQVRRTDALIRQAAKEAGWWDDAVNAPEAKEQADELTRKVEDAAWHEALGRAVIAEQHGKVIRGDLGKVVRTVTSTLGHQPDDVLVEQ